MQLSQEKLKPSLLKDKGVLQINLCSRSDKNIIESASKNRKHNDILQEWEDNRRIYGGTGYYFQYQQPILQYLHMYYLTLFP